MKILNKLFGGLKLTWPKLILFAVIAGVYTGLINQVPFLYNTSFRDIAISFECWIVFGTVIIMNAKNNLDSGLKCLVFFVISQPLVYLTEVPFLGFGILGYYKNWIIWTLLSFPMGFIGHYLKKGKWLGLAILTPVLVFLGIHYAMFLRQTVFSFPNHLLSCLLCLAAMIIFVICFFKVKIIKLTGVIICAVIIIGATVYAFVNPQIYQTDVLYSGGDKGIVFDNTYSVSLSDNSYGDVSIRYEPALEDYMVHADFRRAGNTELVLEAPDGKKKVFDLTIRSDSYEINQKAD